MDEKLVHSVEIPLDEPRRASDDQQGNPFNETDDGSGSRPTDKPSRASIHRSVQARGQNKPEPWVPPWDIVFHGGKDNIPSAAPADSPLKPVKQDVPVLLNSPNKVFKFPSKPKIRRVTRMSDRVHVLGFTSHAKFLAHAIACTPGRSPVQIVAYHPVAEQQWGLEDRSLSLYDLKGFVSDARIPCPEALGAASPHYPGSSQRRHIDNLVVDTLSAAVIPSLRKIRHRINSETTICILHPGLGMVEHIIDELFPDEFDRPNFVIGQSSHKISKLASRKLAVRQITEGRITIYQIPQPYRPYSLDQTKNLIRILDSSPGLNVTRVAIGPFLQWKLHTILFCSIADTVSVILGCSYRKIKENPYAMWLWEVLLDEGMEIISQLPEMKDRPIHLDKVMRRRFRQQFTLHLNSLRMRISPWVAHVRIGREPPFDYFNGYLIRRADELGIDHKHHSMALAMAKARFSSRWRELNAGVPLGSSPYMLDEDLIGGGQDVDSSEYVMLDDAL